MCPVHCSTITLCRPPCTYRPQSQRCYPFVWPMCQSIMSMHTSGKRTFLPQPMHILRTRPCLANITAHGLVWQIIIMTLNMASISASFLVCTACCDYCTHTASTELAKELSRWWNTSLRWPNRPAVELMESIGRVPVCRTHYWLDRDSTPYCLGAWSPHTSLDSTRQSS